MPLRLEPRKKQDLVKRALTIRKEILLQTHAAGSGHPGSSLSAVEILTILYFGGILRYDPKRPNWRERDRFLLSKGHGAPLLYATLAEAGYFDKELLPTLRKLGSPLEGHPNCRKLPGVEASTGSLGQGLSLAAGMALASRLSGISYRVFVLLGDGEMQEGQVFEALLFAGFHRLENLTAIIDYNKFQLDGPVAEILDLEPLKEKLAAFRWEVQEVNGHDFDALSESLSAPPKGMPRAIVAHTVKGKGVSFMEGNNHFHGVAPNDQEFAQAMAELETALQEGTSEN